MGNRPFKGQIEITFGCSLRCVHCYSDCYNNPESIKNELTYKEITNILDQIHNEGCLWLCFTGGDPLARTDFLDIYTYAKKLGFLITIFTNGTLITEEIADYFLKEPPFSIEITLNGISPKTYETISQIPGSFKKAMQGIRLIIERKLPLKIKFQAMTINHYELEKVKEFSKKIGAVFKYGGSMIYPRLDASKEPCKLRLPPSQLIEMNYPQDFCEEIENKKIPDSPSRWSERLFRCAAGINSFAIDPYGNLIFCTFVREPNFSLKEGKFSEGFYSLYPQIRSTEWRTDSKCRECKLQPLCNNCPGKAYLETGDPEAPVDYFCQLAQAKAKKLGFSL
ncbi:MAG: radical SAM protein [Candidatus Omnitrophica bacterium]|nr:radical SAM protein [Candidatus Omnitrophota bacterium]